MFRLLIPLISKIVTPHDRTETLQITSQTRVAYSRSLSHNRDTFGILPDPNIHFSKNKLPSLLETDPIMAPSLKSF